MGEFPRTPPCIVFLVFTTDNVEITRIKMTPGKKDKHKIRIGSQERWDQVTDLRPISAVALGTSVTLAPLRVLVSSRGR